MTAYVRWLAHQMTASCPILSTTRSAPASFDSFVYDPPAQPIGSLLVVGGVPSARAILRLTLPRLIRDSSRVVRATLEFVPAAPLEGTAADSFVVVAHPVIADFGAKSPLNGAHIDSTWIFSSGAVR